MNTKSRSGLKRQAITVRLPMVGSGTMTGVLPIAPAALATSSSPEATTSVSFFCVCSPSSEPLNSVCRVRDKKRCGGPRSQSALRAGYLKGGELVRNHLLFFCVVWLLISKRGEGFVRSIHCFVDICKTEMNASRSLSNLQHYNFRRSLYERKS